MNAHAEPSTAPLAIIAGSGRFPVLVAQEAKRQGREVIVLGIQGWVDPTLAGEVDTYEELGVGALGTLIARLRTHGVRQAIMAGKVTKEILLDPSAAFDADARTLLAQTKDLSVNALLGRLAERLHANGVTLLDSSVFLQSALCPRGVLTSRPPSTAESADIAYGVRIARALALVDVGQTIVVKRGVTVAVEALEGTDATIRRAAKVAGGDLVVVKVASPMQDMRFDLPVLGCETIDGLKPAGVSCVAVEAGKTLLLDKERLIASANAAGLCLIGIDVNAVDE